MKYNPSTSNFIWIQNLKKYLYVLANVYWLRKNMHVKCNIDTKIVTFHNTLLFTILMLCIFVVWMQINSWLHSEKHVFFRNCLLKKRLNKMKSINVFNTKNYVYDPYMNLISLTKKVLVGIYTTCVAVTNILIIVVYIF